MIPPLPDRRWHLVAATGAVLLLGAGILTGVSSQSVKANNALKAGDATNVCTGLGITPVTLQATIPMDFVSLAHNQTGADCFAWQQFIYLNWAADPNNPGVPDPAAPPSQFGAPGQSTTVWESFLSAEVVFAGGASWGQTRPKVMALTTTSLPLKSISQAGNGKWLTNQRGGLTYYDVRMNQDEFEFITTNVYDLTTAAGQAACVQSGSNGKGGLNLPAGGGNARTPMPDFDCNGAAAAYGQNIGSIEIKAAWTPLPADGSLDYRYKTAVALVTDPSGTQTQVTVGLVGLHIIRKVPGAPQFMWSSFEHIDNNPDNNAGNPSGPNLPPNPNQLPRLGFTYFNPNCSVATDPYFKCVPNALPGTPCSVGNSPPGCVPYSAPMQITRMTPVDTIANQVTAWAWSLFPADSVFNYYRLVDVQWPNQPTGIPPGATTPLSTGDITPRDATRIMANTTLETYLQSSFSCMDCHQAAPIKSPPSQRFIASSLPLEFALDDTIEYASDYSFVFVANTTR